MKKVCVFVDGENFRHSIVDLFEDFQSKDYLPKKANWSDFFNHLVEMAVPGPAYRFRTYWYVIEFMDFAPQLPKNDSDRRKSFARYIKKHQHYKKLYPELNPDDMEKIDVIVEQLNQTKMRMQKRFEGWRRIHTGISTRFDRFEFRTAGSIKYDLITEKLGAEKGVDVKLAIDLVRLHDIYDVAVILSGDQDYVPAVQAIKDYGKTVVNVAFKTRSGKLLPGGAWRLNQETDWGCNLKYDDVANHLNV